MVLLCGGCFDSHGCADSGRLDLHARESSEVVEAPDADWAGQAVLNCQLSPSQAARLPCIAAKIHFAGSGLYSGSIPKVKSSCSPTRNVSCHINALPNRDTDIRHQSPRATHDRYSLNIQDCCLGPAKRLISECGSYLNTYSPPVVLCLLCCWSPRWPPRDMDRALNLYFLPTGFGLPCTRERCLCLRP